MSEPGADAPFASSGAAASFLRRSVAAALASRLAVACRESGTWEGDLAAGAGPLLTFRG